MELRGWEGVAVNGPKVEKLTTREVRFIDEPFNVADAHARFAPTRLMLGDLVPQLDVLFLEATRIGQRAADKRGYDSFMGLSGQSSAVELQSRFIPVYSSSVALEIVANVLAMRWQSALVQIPTFDNIPAILTRNRVHASPYDFFAGAPPASLAPGAPVVVVSPNNPTGSFLSEDELLQLATACASGSRPLILDASFRLFDEEACFDHYAILRQSECEFVVIEDTGKIWPTTDLKVAYLVASPSLDPMIRSIADDVLLNVSPFVSLLVEALASDPRYLGEVRDLVARNRGRLQAGLGAFVSENHVRFPHGASKASVELLQVSRQLLGQTSLSEVLEAAEVVSLSSESFWWSGSHEIEERAEWSEVRIALSRDEDPFGAVVDRTAEVLTRLVLSSRKT